jgi:hypothetical protein
VRLLYGTLGEQWHLDEGVREVGMEVEPVPLATLVGRLQNNLDPFLLADAIALDEPGTFSTLHFEGRDNSDALMQIIRALRNLPARSAMADGRRWSALPIIVLGHIDLDPRDLTDEVSGLGVTIVPRNLGAGQKSGREAFRDTVLDLVGEYRQRLLAEYEELGFLVTQDHGRFRLAPALARRKRDAETPLYSSMADRRDPHRWFTVGRDAIGVAYEVELFEALISRRSVTEDEIQKFLEEHPHFITMSYWSSAIPQPRFGGEGGTLIPDFVLAPIVAERRARDSEWQVLDLKRPQVPLMVGRDGRRRFSAHVWSAIAQLHQYRGYFENPAHSNEIALVLGRTVRRPQLAILIGRQHASEDLDALDAEQERTNVRIITYDEILDRQRAFYHP